MTPPLDCTLTLDAIRAQRPCRSGWLSLLRYLGQTEASIDLKTRISLGDIAVANGMRDAWWCVRALHYENVQVRRALISVLIPSLRRISAPREIVELISEWCAGADINLRTLGQKASAEAAKARAAWTEAHRAGEAAEATWWAAESAKAAAWWAAESAAAAAYAAWWTEGLMAAWAQTWWAEEAAAAAAEIARAAAWAVGTAEAAKMEHEAQKNDLIAAFPPLHQAAIASSALRSP